MWSIWYVHSTIGLTREADYVRNHVLHVCSKKGQGLWKVKAKLREKNKNNDMGENFSMLLVYGITFNYGCFGAWHTLEHNRIFKTLWSITWRTNNNKEKHSNNLTLMCNNKIKCHLPWLGLGIWINLNSKT